jgi:hypothetical protein
MRSIEMSSLGETRTKRLRKQGTMALPFLAATCIAVLWWGWSIREQLYLTPSFGLGYSLGVAGTALMALLLLYSLRKRLRIMRSWGSIRHWFIIHMILGIIGPIAILFHANFKLGSLNSTVALCCVFLVSSSGLIGRIIYPKIHHGLSGRRASLRELKQDAESHRGAVSTAISSSSHLGRMLKDFEAYALAEGRGVVSTTWRFLTLGIRARSVQRRALRILQTDAPHVDPRSMARGLRPYVEGIRRVAQFSSFERLFSVWHAFHFPICVMLFAAAVIHVIAVHMY